MKTLKLLFVGLTLLLYASQCNAQNNVNGKGFYSYNVSDTAFIQTTRTSLETSQGNTGVLYFDKTRDKWRVWNGSAYVNLISTGSTGVLTLSNGLTKTGTNGTLGGLLTGTTNLTGAGTADLNIGTSGSPLDEWSINSDNSGDISSLELSITTDQSIVMQSTNDDISMITGNGSISMSNNIGGISLSPTQILVSTSTTEPIRFESAAGNFEALMGGEMNFTTNNFIVTPTNFTVASTTSDFQVDDFNITANAEILINADNTDFINTGVFGIAAASADFSTVGHTSIGAADINLSSSNAIDLVATDVTLNGISTAIPLVSTTILSGATLRNCGTTPITLVPAQGSGMCNYIYAVTFSFGTGSTAYDFADELIVGIGADPVTDAGNKFILDNAWINFGTNAMGQFVVNGTTSGIVNSGNHPITLTSASDATVGTKTVTFEVIYFVRPCPGN